jgi:hypothetical protein
LKILFTILKDPPLPEAQRPVPVESNDIKNQYVKSRILRGCLEFNRFFLMFVIPFDRTQLAVQLRSSVEFKQTVTSPADIPEPGVLQQPSSRAILGNAAMGNNSPRTRRRLKAMAWQAHTEIPC